MKVYMLMWNGGKMPAVLVDGQAASWVTRKQAEEAQEELKLVGQTEVVEIELANVSNWGPDSRQ